MKENQWKMKGKPIQTEKQKKTKKTQKKSKKKSEPQLYCVSYSCVSLVCVCAKPCIKGPTINNEKSAVQRIF